MYLDGTTPQLGLLDPPKSSLTVSMVLFSTILFLPNFSYRLTFYTAVFFVGGLYPVIFLDF